MSKSLRPLGQSFSPCKRLPTGYSFCSSHSSYPCTFYCPFPALFHYHPQPPQGQRARPDDVGVPRAVPLGQCLCEQWSHPVRTKVGHAGIVPPLPPLKTVYPHVRHVLNEWLNEWSRMSYNKGPDDSVFHATTTFAAVTRGSILLDTPTHDCTLQQVTKARKTIAAGRLRPVSNGFLDLHHIFQFVDCTNARNCSKED